MIIPSPEEQKGIARFLDLSREVFTRDRPCIINTDIDGILTGTILQNCLGWKVVGFCDSKDTIFIDPTYASQLKEVIFIDIYIHDPRIVCVDQHIVSPNQEFSMRLFDSETKLNPNIQRMRYASPSQSDPNSYAWKYPFGTVHFIIAVLESFNFHLKIEDKRDGEVSTFDLILRADDAARTTAYRYAKNAADWWQWLNVFGGELTAKLSTMATQSTKEYADTRYDLLKVLFRGFGCHTNDGNFSKQLKKNGGRVSEKLGSLFEYVGSMLGMPVLELPKEFSNLTGEFLLEAAYNHEQIAEVLGRKDLFSYAYTYCMGPLAAKGFSYTLMDTDGLSRGGA